jgi:isoleucyl-tRNA synthetase
MSLNLKDTLNLPKTAFPMKADLVTREPERIRHWDASDTYARVRSARKGAETFVLHDGPPFANGDIHLGHVLNKVLKDIVVRYKTLRGYDAHFRHRLGLPRLAHRACRDAGTAQTSFGNGCRQRPPSM